MTKLAYDSLSYAWGEPICNKETEVNEGTMMLTTSLHTALKYLRKVDGPRIIWADGICLNQRDIGERSSQMKLMREIYSNANQLQIWLGEVAEILCEASCDDVEVNLLSGDQYDAAVRILLEARSELTDPPLLASAASTTDHADILSAFEILELIAGGKHLHEMPFLTVTSQSRIQLSRSWYRSLRALCMILSRPWWNRLWVVQEVALSSNATVCIGTYEVSLTLFLNVGKPYSTHILGCCSAYRHIWCGGIEIMMKLSVASMIAHQLEKAIEAYARQDLNLETLLDISMRRETLYPTTTSMASSVS